MQARATHLDGMLLLDHMVQADQRGTFSVLWNSEALRAAGVAAEFLQDNLIKTHRGTLRGLHFQTRHPQGKLLTVVEGEVYDAAVDLRPQSPTFGQSAGFVLRSGDGTSLWLPPGFAHGFLALSEEVIYLYKVTAPWDPEEAPVLAWDDPEVGLQWPLVPGQTPVLSDRDRSGLSLGEVRALVG
jgi:dTDP-4-dehydrorhamnose 3,5-epimerase